MEEAHFIFTSDPIEIKSEGENFFVEGYISTSDLDLVNDVVTKACILDMAEQMKQRSIKFDVEHESFRGKSKLERETNKTIIPVAKVEDFLVDKKGLKVRAMLNKHSIRFEEVKGSIQDGFLDAFSIAYVPIKAEVQEKNGQQIRLLDKINLLNVAFTGNPINTEARMVNVFAKSLEFLQEQEEKNMTRTQQRNEAMREEEDEKEEDEKKKKEEEGKDHNHISDNLIKLQEVNKKMSEEKEKAEEIKDETVVEQANVEESAEVKALKEEVKSLKEKQGNTEKELAEIKSQLIKPVLKSKVEQQDKSNNFVAEKSKNPLDLIA